jgi:hypothetical protein
MIRRGTALSRNLALLILFTPLLVGAAAFGQWAHIAWQAASDRLILAQKTERELAARNIQSQAYIDLLDQWRDYADTPASGLAPPATDETAATDLIARIRDTFQQSGGTVSIATHLGANNLNGLRRTQVEILGQAPSDKLDEMLSALESETPFIFVDMISLSTSTASADGVNLRLRLSCFRLLEVRG